MLHGTILANLNNIANIQTSDIKTMANLSNKNFQILKDSMVQLIDDLGFVETLNTISLKTGIFENIIITQKISLITNNKDVFKVDSSGHVYSVYAHNEDISESLRFRWYRYEKNRGVIPPVGTDGEVIYYYGTLYLYVANVGWVVIGGLDPTVPPPSSSMWLGAVIDIVGTPPVGVEVGDRYIVSDSGTTGEFVGNENKLAEYTDTGWLFNEVLPGSAAIVTNRSNNIYYLQETPEMWVQNGYFYDIEVVDGYTVRSLKQKSFYTGIENPQDIIVSSEKID